MDVQRLELELYGLKPSEFTAARDAYVAQARKAGDKQLATAIAALRKPTLAAWTAGLLARHRPEEARGLVQLGEALRAAHRALDAGQLRKLSHDQHVVIGGLARTARSLAAESGQQVSEQVLHEVEQILHTVLADSEVAERWQAGRLAKAPEATSGFTGLEPLPGTAPPRREQPAAAGPRPHPVQFPKPGQSRDARAAAARAHRERMTQARTELHKARAEAERLEAEHAAAQEKAAHAAAAVTEAEDDVRAAKDRLATARTTSSEAAAGLRAADRAAAKARERAETEARKTQKLTGSKG
ncbi:hypothetical protein OG898_28225 [Streptomyces sp. NBC_00193]|uniref:hypothetical protein n=1 Tax=Streptomyces sp. NBC_00193 TaxID=2975675 RepID=UPI00224E69A2|nr:hypothetical protein [Streptomyces sp. NBC_00193]MCX5300323.1 hypothetical protein [Streptomyces sp. NBC_00193]